MCGEQERGGSLSLSLSPSLSPSPSPSPSLSLPLSHVSVHASYTSGAAAAPCASSGVRQHSSVRAAQLELTAGGVCAATLPQVHETSAPHQRRQRAEEAWEVLGVELLCRYEMFARTSVALRQFQKAKKRVVVYRTTMSDALKLLQEEIEALRQEVSWVSEEREELRGERAALREAKGGMLARIREEEKRVRGLENKVKEGQGREEEIRGKLEKKGEEMASTVERLEGEREREREAKEEAERGREEARALLLQLRSDATETEQRITALEQAVERTRDYDAVKQALAEALQRVTDGEERARAAEEEQGRMEEEAERERESAKEARGRMETVLGERERRDQEALQRENQLKAELRAAIEKYNKLLLQAGPAASLASAPHTPHTTHSPPSPTGMDEEEAALHERLRKQLGMVAYDDRMARHSFTASVAVAKKTFVDKVGRDDGGKEALSALEMSASNLFERRQASAETLEAHLKLIPLSTLQLMAEIQALRAQVEAKEAEAEGERSKVQASERVRGDLQARVMTLSASGGRVEVVMKTREAQTASWEELEEEMRGGWRREEERAEAEQEEEEEGEEVERERRRRREAEAECEELRRKLGELKRELNTLKKRSTEAWEAVREKMDERRERVEAEQGEEAGSQEGEEEEGERELVRELLEAGREEGREEREGEQEREGEGELWQAQQERGERGEREERERGGGEGGGGGGEKKVKRVSVAAAVGQLTAQTTLLQAMSAVYQQWWRTGGGSGGPGMALWKWAKGQYGLEGLAEERAREVVRGVRRRQGARGVGLRLRFFGEVLGLFGADGGAGGARGAHHLSFYLRTLADLPLAASSIPPTAEEASTSRGREGLPPRVRLMLESEDQAAICWMPLEAASDAARRALRPYPQVSMTGQLQQLRAHAEQQHRRKECRTAGMVNVDYLMHVLLAAYASLDGPEDAARAASQRHTPVAGSSSSSSSRPSSARLQQQQLADQQALALLRQAFGPLFGQVLAQTLRELSVRVDAAAAHHCYAMLIGAVEAARRAVAAYRRPDPAQDSLQQLLPRLSSFHASSRPPSASALPRSASSSALASASSAPAPLRAPHGSSSPPIKISLRPPSAPRPLAPSAPSPRAWAPAPHILGTQTARLPSRDSLFAASPVKPPTPSTGGGWGEGAAGSPRPPTATRVRPKSAVAPARYATSF